MAKAKPGKSSAKAKKSAPTRTMKSVKAAKHSKPGKPGKPGKPAKPAAKAAKAAKPAAGKGKPAAKAKAGTVPSKSAAKAGAHAAKINGAGKNDSKPASVKQNGVRLNLSPFLKKQQERLLQLRDSLLDVMAGVAKDNLRSRAEGSEASAFGMHQADAGSDAYDRDFALSLLSQEQDALYEIEEALKRIELGTYGTCEMTGKPIAHARLEALPFARYTVECQSQLEKQSKVSRARVPVTSLFGLTDEEPGESEEEEPVAENKE
jgi:RNA polymerase-binding transcription factor DksA